MIYQVEITDAIAPENAKRVLAMIEETLKIDGEFALLRIPYSFPQDLIPQALLRLRATLDELAASELTQQRRVS